MEFIADAVKAKVAASCGILTDKSRRLEDSSSRLWREIEVKLRHRYSTWEITDFSITAELPLYTLAEGIVEKHLQALIEHATTPPNSIGERWIDDCLFAYRVERDLKKAWQDI
jgi:hypothetical protein